MMTYALPDKIIFRDVPARRDVAANKESTNSSTVALFNENGHQIGSPLDDNVYENYRDNFRYHDVYHYAFDRLIGWSPVSKNITDHFSSAPQLEGIEEVCVLMVHHHYKQDPKDPHDGDMIARSYEILMDHTNAKIDFKTYRTAMDNAHDVLQEMIEIKEEANYPVEITIEHDEAHKRLHVSGVRSMLEADLTFKLWL